MPEFIPSEDAEQIGFVAYLELRKFKFAAIPNSTYTPHMSVKARNERLGVRPGVPDLMVILPNQGIAWVEMKRIKGGKVSPHQKVWIEALQALPGNEARVCNGAQEAIKFIEELCPSGMKMDTFAF